MALVQFADDFTREISVIIKPKENNTGGLYLGNLKAAQNLELLKARKITSVISVISEVKVQLPHTFNHLIIDIDDSPFQNIYDHFAKSNKFIEKHIQSGNVFIHCYAGISRSASLTVSFLMKSQRKSLKHAIRKVKKNRNFIEPNKGFLSQLQDFQSHLSFGQHCKLK